jgi:hypothetical protein
VDKDTVLSLLLSVAHGAEALHNRLVRDLDVVHIEADELAAPADRNATPAFPDDST